MLAAATLLFLIALPMVNCRRRNTFHIEQLDEGLRGKGKRGNRVNQAMNAYSRGKEQLFSVKEVCDMLSEAYRKCRDHNKTNICNATDPGKSTEYNIKKRASMEYCHCLPYRSGKAGCVECKVSKKYYKSLFH